MKKIIALLTTLALLISAVALPAFAEGETGTPDQVTSATRETGRGGPNGQQPPTMPGNGQNRQGGPGGRQAPGRPGSEQGSQDGRQAPTMPGSEQGSQDGQQAPTMPGSDQGSQDGQDTRGGKGGKHSQGRSGKKGRGDRGTPGSRPESRLDLDQLVKDNVISQEVCDAILSYMKEHAPQGQPEGTAPADGAQAPAEGSEPPALPEGEAPAEGSEPPAKPEGDQDAPGGMEEQLLKELLDGNVITQEIYDLLMAKLTATVTTTDTTAETTASGT